MSTKGLAEESFRLQRRASCHLNICDTAATDTSRLFDMLHVLQQTVSFCFWIFIDNCNLGDVQFKLKKKYVYTFIKNHSASKGITQTGD